METQFKFQKGVTTNKKEPSGRCSSPCSRHTPRPSPGSGLGAAFGGTRNTPVCTWTPQCSAFLGLLWVWGATVGCCLDPGRPRHRWDGTMLASRVLLISEPGKWKLTSSPASQHPLENAAQRITRPLVSRLLLGFGPRHSRGLRLGSC